MDSMMAVEIKQTLEREFQVFLTPQDIRGMTFSKLQDLAAQTENEPAATAQGIIVWLNKRYCRLFTLSFYTVSLAHREVQPRGPLWTSVVLSIIHFGFGLPTRRLAFTEKLIIHSGLLTCRLRFTKKLIVHCWPFTHWLGFTEKLIIHFEVNYSLWTPYS